MNKLKKLNLGLVLTVIVIAALVIYLAVLDGQRKDAKSEILKVSQEYIELADKYAVLPEKYQVIGTDAKKVNLDEYESNMKAEFAKFSANDVATNTGASVIMNTLKNDLLSTQDIRTKFDRKITKIRSYEFDGNTVTVTFDSKVNVTEKYAKINPENGEFSEEVREKSYDLQRETICLEKKENQWKVSFANVSYDNLDSASGQITIGM